MRIALFQTCIGDTLFPETGRALVAVLERLGHEIVFPPGQTCCGQLHLNSGYRDEATALAGRFQRTFADHELVVAPSSSCVGMVRHFHPELLAEAEVGAGRLYELSELLADRLGQVELGACFPHRVAYHPTCHSLRVARIGDAPLRLLRAVEGLELAELGDGGECCGFVGTFALKNADTSLAILADKCAAIEASGAEVCTAVDPSCLLQIGGGLSRRGGRVRALHLAEILAAGAP